MKKIIFALSFLASLGIAISSNASETKPVKKSETEERKPASLFMDSYEVATGVCDDEQILRGAHDQGYTLITVVKNSDSTGIQYARCFFYFKKIDNK